MSNKITEKFSRLTLKEQILFTKRLSMLVRAGVPLPQAIHMIQHQSRTTLAKHVFGHLRNAVEQGQSLANAMREFPTIFGEFAINIIEVGESSGTLQENLEYLAEELQRKQQLLRKLRSAAIYPSFIMLATLGIVLLLTVVVFPKILPIFNNFQFDLPWTTRILMFASSIVREYWYILLSCGIVVIISCLILLKRPTSRILVHKILLTSPGIGQLLVSYYMAVFSRTLGTLLKGELPIVRAMYITANTVVNTHMRQCLQNAQSEVSDGRTISQALSEKEHLFPSTLVQMIAIAESTGNLSKTLLFLADLYESEVDEQTKRLTILLEPVLMIIMGVVVGFVAISIITPIYGITQNLHP